MNIYRFELKALRKATIIWTCSIIALAALYLSIYPSMAKDVADFKKLLAAYPAPVREMLGINIDTIGSLLGFYSMVFSFILLCGAIQAMNYGVSILSKESRERTADFLYVKPVSRTSIITAKLFASLTMIIATNIVFCLASSLLANIVKTADYSIKLFFLINLTLLFTQLIFLAIGMVVSVFFGKIKNVLPITLGFVFGFYLIGAVLAVGETKEYARVLSPFKYFDITYIMNHESYEALYLIISAVIILVSILVTYLIFNKKDIHAVN